MSASSSSAPNGAAVSGPGARGKVPIAPLPIAPLGCFTCRLRRKKCDEARPSCGTCTKLGIKCEYRAPIWWSTGEQRRRQKDRIKDRIRQTKVMEKHGSLKEYMDRIRALTERSPKTSDKESNRPMMGEQYNWNAPILPPPFTPCNINVTSETLFSPGFPPPFQASSSSSMSFSPVSPSQGPMSSQMHSQLPTPMSTQAPFPEPVQMTPQMPTEMATSMHVPMHDNQMSAQLPADMSVQMHDNQMSAQLPADMSVQMYDNQMSAQGHTDMAVPMYDNQVSAQGHTDMAVPMYDNQVSAQGHTDMSVPMYDNQMSVQMPTEMPVQMHDTEMHCVQMHAEMHCVQMHAEMPTQVAAEVAPQASADFSAQMPTQASTEMSISPQTSLTPAEIAAQLPIQLETQVRTQMPIIMPVQVPTPRLPTDGWFGNNIPNIPSTPSIPSIPTLPGMNHYHNHNSFGQLQHYSTMNIPGFVHSNGPSPVVPLHSIIALDEKDRPYLDHFIDNLLDMGFPIVKLHQGAQLRLNETFKIMQYNRSFLHCCLSVAAIHMKTSQGLDDQMDHEIMQHRYEAISLLCRALARGHNPIQVIDATLGMIFYHCKISNTDDYLPDIPWSAHFQGVATLVKKLEKSPSQFNISLITWIDILGSTMKGTTPHFAHAYRTKHLSGTPSGLRGLMGCSDRVMYLISEAACLESLWLDGEMNNGDLCGHVAALKSQVDFTEPTDRSLQYPYGPNGEIMAMPLTKSISALFRIATRIYLHSLLPGFDRFDFTVTNLVASVPDILNYIPGGFNGYDRCIVWPLFIVGAYSTPACLFRRVLTERITAMGYLGDFASFGRMYRVLREIWRLAEGPLIEPSDEEDAPGSPESVDSNATIRPPNRQTREPVRENLHWREVMKRNKWDFLLL
ncbi:DNA-binding transcriptional regulator ume6 [Aspergillus melleus]|uniref:DNA-binding transcriptional regulator ume6 n=1 Tax=Aspergillus melleus TaxID=138277 RepID=A0ACC3B4M7_9EURO|nr:DNA-binding transcriptional regulator ume6 [Aspergillus melleus]